MLPVVAAGQPGHIAHSNTIHRRVNTFVVPQEFGAVGDGVADDTAALVAALATSDYVLVPEGVYAHTGLTVGTGKTLELLPGAELVGSASVVVAGPRARLIGSHESVPSLSNPRHAHLSWAGPTNGVVLDVANSSVGVGSIGLEVRRISIDCKLVSGVKGMRVGNGTDGMSACALGDISILNGAGIGTYAMHIVQAVQLTTFDHVVTESTFERALFLEGAGGGAITTVYFVDCHFNASKIGYVLGGASGAGGAACQFIRCNLDGYDTTGVDAAAGDYLFDGCRFEPASGGETNFIVGRNGGAVDGLRVVNSVIGGGNSGEMFRGIGWRLLQITNNFIGLLSGTAVGFNNVGGGSARIAGRYENNIVFAGTGASELVGGMTGFESFIEERPDVSDIPDLLWHLQSALRITGPMTVGADVAPADTAMLDLLLADGRGNIGFALGQGAFSRPAIANGDTTIVLGANARPNGDDVYEGVMGGRAGLLRLGNDIPFVIYHNAVTVPDTPYAPTLLFYVLADGSVHATGIVMCPASSAARASANVPVGAAPAAPVEGDIWQDGADLFIHLGGVTRTINTTP